MQFAWTNRTSVLLNILFHISSKFDFFIGVEMVMCRTLICVTEIHQSLIW